MCKKLLLSVLVSLFLANIALGRGGLIGYWRFNEGEVRYLAGYK